MHEILRRTIGEALGQSGAPELQVKSVSSDLSHQEITQSIPGVLSGMSVSSRWAPGKPGFEPFERSVDSGRHVDLQATSLNTTGLDEIKPMIPLGQFRDTFIIAVDDEGVVIVDQHVAHERVLFEKVMKQLTSGRLESQRLLEPVLINLLPDQLQTLISHSTDLARFGFEVDEFGGKNLRVTSLPALLDFGSCETAIQSLANDLDALGDGSLVQGALKQIAATTACHAAVKANDSLTQEKMSYILDELRKTSYSTVCPHGRPVVLRLTRDEIEKRFERI
jgi:DNA mismatch repair protein MutL